jgi:hypothetical protein
VAFLNLLHATELVINWHGLVEDTKFSSGFAAKLVGLVVVVLMQQQVVKYS